MKSFVENNPGTVFIILFFTTLMASDCFSAIKHTASPDYDACTTVCGAGNVKSITAADCVCK